MIPPLKFQVPSCKFKVKSLPSNFEPATWNLELLIVLRGWRGERLDSRPPFGGRSPAQRGLLVRGVHKLAQRPDEGELKRGLRLLYLGERGESRVAPLGRGRDALLYVRERFEPNLARRRHVAR